MRYKGKKYDEDYYAFKPIDTSRPIVLDFTNCRYLGEVHLILKKTFGFPEYYGENWSALWDCLDGLFLGEGLVIVRIIGYYSMKDGLPEFCTPMLKVFDDVHAKTPNVVFELLS